MHSYNENIIQVDKSDTGAARYKSRQAGFSLVEVLVAIVILTIGIVAFLQIFPPGFLGLQVASNTSNADRIAQETLQQLLSNGSSNIQEIAAVDQIYTDSAGDPTDAGMINIDPNFNPDAALSTPGLQLNYPKSPAPTAIQEAMVANGFNVANSSTIAPFTPTEQYEYVKGENITVPLPSGVPTKRTAAGTYVQGQKSTSILSFGPIIVPEVGGTDYFNNYPGPTDNSDGLATGGDFYHSLDNTETPAFFVHGTPWGRVVGSSAPLNGVGSLDYTALTGISSSYIPQSDPDVELTQDAPSYLMDYTNQAIGLRVPTFTNTALANNGTYKQTFQIKFQYVDTTLAQPIVKTGYTWFRACWPRPAGDTNVHDIDFYSEKALDGTAITKSHWIPLKALVNIGIDSAGAALPTVWQVIPNSEVVTRDFQMVNPSLANNGFDNDPYEFELDPASLLGHDNSTNPTYLGELAFNPLAATLVGGHGTALHATVDYMASDWHIIHEDRTVGAQSNITFGATGTSTSRLTFNHLLKIGSSDQLGNNFYGIGGSFANPGPGGSDIVVFDLDTFELLSNGTDYTVDYTNGSVSFPNYPSGAHVRILYKPAQDWGVTVLKPAARYTPITFAANGSSVTPSTEGVFVEADPSVTTNPYVIYFPKVDSGRQVQIDGTATYTPTSGTPTTVTISKLVTIEPANGVASTTSIPVAVLPANATNVTENLNVRGASMTVRVIWREQALWHHRDVTTIDIPSTPAS